MYKEIQSEFIKKKINGLEFSKENRKYIANLFFLERWILGEAGGMGAAYMVHSLKDKCREEYEAIFKELDPEGFEEFKKREKEKKMKEEKERRKWERQRKRKLEQEKKEWEEMGGVV